jgi:biotin synthase
VSNRKSGSFYFSAAGLNGYMTLEEIFVLGDEELFSRARRAGERYKKAYWSPVVINGGCKSNPHCMHCKWESFKNCDPEFNGKRPLDDVLRRAEAALKAGATHLLAPSGWMGYEVPEYFCDYIRALKSRFEADIYGLYGSISKTSLSMLRDAGMDGYQCGLESPDEGIYRRFRPGGDSLDDRKKTLAHAKGAGLKIWSGFLIGFGITDEAALEGLKFLKGISPDWVAVQPFVPYPGTQFQKEDPTNPYRWARLMAIARLYFGDGVNLVATENSGAYANFLSLTGANAFFIFPNSAHKAS